MPPRRISFAVSNHKRRSQNRGSESARRLEDLQEPNRSWVRNQYREWRSSAPVLPSGGGSSSPRARSPSPAGSDGIEQLHAQDDIDVDFTDTHIFNTPGHIYRYQRLNEERNWQAVLPDMLVAYMSRLHETKQWGDQQTWNEDSNNICTCVPRIKTVDVVDVTFRGKIDVSFCGCVPDQVRLIKMGYIGGTPMFPQTAYSIRLLRLYHNLWKFCCIRIQPFTLGLDAYLDASNPLILVAGTTKPRLWRVSFSSAVDAYRQLLTMQDDLAARSLQLTPLQKLGNRCPRCFGPMEVNPRPDEPDYMVCIDGNFQHRRHEAASNELVHSRVRYPSFFLTPEEVDQWDPRSGPSGDNDQPVDPCIASHTAASDNRNASTWKGCDETGLVGLACRHDQCLLFVNVVKSGEKQHYAIAMMDRILKDTDELEKPPKKLGVLYDIGCTLEKGIKRERERGQLKFGTGAWHSYAHNIGCQLLYNPRMNAGWGKTDGEGNERIWWDFDPLIRGLRYVTKQHRLDALNFRALHHNDLGRRNSVQSTMRKLKMYETEYLTTSSHLEHLETSMGLDKNFLAGQWEQQKRCQMEAFASDSLKRLEEKLLLLMDVEEQLRLSTSKLQNLRQQRRRDRSEDENNLLLTLPASIVALEETAEKVAIELGSDQFRNLAEARDPKACCLIRIRVAKEKLYEAKVGVLEWQKWWDRGGHGTTLQADFRRRMKAKQQLLNRKWETYSTTVQLYNNRWGGRSDRIQEVSLQQVRSLSLEDVFWNLGALKHPNEPWAVNENVQSGILAYLSNRGCEEELRRIAREVRQMIKYALESDNRLKTLIDLSEKEWDPQCEGQVNPIRLVQPHKGLSREVWSESQDVLKSLHQSISLSNCRLWMTWSTDIIHLLEKTERYSISSAEGDVVLKKDWEDLVGRSLEMWEKIVRAKSIVAEPLELLEDEEQRLFLGGDDEIYAGGQIHDDAERYEAEEEDVMQVDPPVV